MRLIAFDFDGTLTEERLIDILARRFGFEEQLKGVLERTKPGFEQSMEIAWLLRGLSLSDVLATARGSNFLLGVRETLRALKSRRCVVGVISDSYKQAIEAAMEGLPVDFVEANELVDDDGVLTGEIRMPFGWAKSKGCLKHSVCKLAALRRAADRFGVDMADTVAVGNGEIDICMVEAAGLGIALNPTHPELRRAADVVVEGRDLKQILRYIL